MLPLRCATAHVAARRLMFTPVALPQCHRAAGRDSSSTPTRAGRLGSASAQNQHAKGSGDGSSMYYQPVLYDEVFSYRDFPAEAKAIKAAYQRHCLDKPLQKLLELGCGPARHAMLLAKQGVSVWALDSSPAMLDYARQLAEKEGADVTFVQGDMADFSIQGLEGSFDAAICLLGTFSHMTTNDQAVSSFSCISRHLRPGGMFLLELAHPGDLFDGTLIIGDEGGEMWEVESASQGTKLLVEWGAHGDDFDPATQVLSRTVAVNRLDGQDTSDCIHESKVMQRSFTLQELDLLGRLTGLVLRGAYGDLDLKVGLRHEDAYRLVACFVKKG